MADPQDEHQREQLEDRINFKRLLATNPNFFGNLKDSPFKSVKTLVASTVFEDITCVGYNPGKGVLEATIAVKLPYGYGGDLCTAGTTEYVRFFVDKGAGWEHVGMTGVKVHDIPTEADCAGAFDKPLTFVAALPYAPEGDCCDNPLLPKVRAVLSWQTIPPDDEPDWLPPWGARYDCYIQIKPGPWTLECLFGNLQITLPSQLQHVQHLPIPQPEPAPHTLAELAEIYTPQTAKDAAEAKTAVEPSRFGLPDLQPMLSAGGFDPDLVVTKQATWKLAGLDWPKALEELQQTKANVDYEQLECLGLDSTFPERLVATFRIKRPTGYSGNLCGRGSQEHIAFWADWDDTCEWTYLGTETVDVHDIATIPPEGLHYSAIHTIDPARYSTSCKTPRVARVRAVLSWSTPPSTTDPEDLGYYGNRVDTHVLLVPGVDGELARIRNIGGIAVEDIKSTVFGTGTGMTRTHASSGGPVVFAHTPSSTADGWGLNRPCPFGGRIWIEGPFIEDHFYRVKVQKLGGHVQYLTGAFQVERTGPGYDLQAPVVGEWFRFLRPAGSFTRQLAYWDSSGDEQWRVTLDVATAPDAGSIVGTSGSYVIQLDNTPPVGPPASRPTMDVHLTSVPDCQDVVQGDVIMGTFVADDLHFGGWWLSTEPNTFRFPSNQPEVAGLPRSDPAPGPAGHEWTLRTTLPPEQGVEMRPCGYVVRLGVSDRTIVNSVPSSHNSNSISVGFCLRSGPR